MNAATTMAQELQDIIANAETDESVVQSIKNLVKEWEQKCCRTEGNGMAMLKIDNDLPYYLTRQSD